MEDVLLLLLAFIPIGSWILYGMMYFDPTLLAQANSIGFIFGSICIAAVFLGLVFLVISYTITIWIWALPAFLNYLLVFGVISPLGAVLSTVAFISALGVIAWKRNQINTKLSGVCLTMGTKKICLGRTKKE